MSDVDRNIPTEGNSYFPLVDSLSAPAAHKSYVFGIPLMQKCWLGTPMTLEVKFHCNHSDMDAQRRHEVKSWSQQYHKNSFCRMSPMHTQQMSNSGITLWYHKLRPLRELNKAGEVWSHKWWSFCEISVMSANLMSPVLRFMGGHQKRLQCDHAVWHCSGFVKCETIVIDLCEISVIH